MRDTATPPSSRQSPPPVETRREELGRGPDQNPRRPVAEQRRRDAGRDLRCAEPGLGERQPVASPGFERRSFGQAGGERFGGVFEPTELLEQPSLQVAEAVPGREVGLLAADPLRFVEGGLVLSNGLELDQTDTGIVVDRQRQQGQGQGDHRRGHTKR